MNSVEQRNELVEHTPNLQLKVSERSRIFHYPDDDFQQALNQLCTQKEDLKDGHSYP